MDVTVSMDAPSSPNRAISATERAVAALWNEVLELSGDRCATDNFFALGGDSIAMVTLLFQLQDEFSVELPPDALLGAPSLGELSALIDTIVSDSG